MSAALDTPMIEASYGNGLAVGVGRRMADRHAPPVVGFVTDLERSSRRRLISELSAAPVIGIGSGTAVDAAKRVAWQRSSPLWLVPSLPSVDASFRRTVAVREAGGVRC